MKKIAGILSVLLILSACFGIYRSAAGIKDISSSKEYWEDQAVQAKDSLTKLDDGIALLGENEQAYINGVDQVAQGEKDLAKGKADLAAGKAQLAQGKQALTAGEKKLAAGKNAVAAGEKKLAAGRAEVIVGEAKLAKAKVLLENGKKQLDDLEKSGLQPGIVKFNKGLDEWKEGYEALKDGKAQIAKAAGAGNFNKVAEQVEGGLDIVSALCDASTAPTKYKPYVEQMNNMMSVVKGKLEQLKGAASFSGDAAQSKELLSNAQETLSKDTSTPEEIADAKATAKAAVTSNPQLGGALQTICGMFDDATDGQNNAAGCYTAIANGEASANNINVLMAACMTVSQSLSENINEITEGKALLQKWLDGYNVLDSEKITLADGAQQISAGIEGNETLRAAVKSIGGAKAAQFLEALAYDKPLDNGVQIITYIKQADIEDIADPKFMSLIDQANQILQAVNTGIEQKKAEYQQGLKDYAAGEKKLAAGKAALAKGEKDLAAGKAEVAKGEKDLAAGKAKFAQGEKDVAAGEVKVADGEAQLADGKAQLARYEDGEAQLIYGLKIALAIEGYTGVDSIKARLGDKFNFMKANKKNVNLSAASDVVKAGRDQLSESELKVTNELMPKLYGNIAVIIASILALLGGFLGLKGKHKGAGIVGGLAAVSAGAGAAFIAKAGTEMAEIAGSSILGTSLYIGAFVLLAVGLVHAIVNLATKKEA